MVIVLVAGYHKILIPAVLNMGIDTYVIKENKTKVFFYVDSPLCKEELFLRIKKAIHQQCGKQYAYQLFTLYQGMIDLSDYLPTHLKDQNIYYQNKNKDLSKKELTTFLHTLQGGQK